MTNFFILQAAFTRDTASVFSQESVTAQTIADNSKFWLVEHFWQFLHRLGVSAPFADLITFLTAALVLAGLVWLVDFAIIKVSLMAIKRRAEKSKTTIDDILVEQKFFSRLLQLVPLLVILILSRIIFAGFDETMILYVRLVTLSIIVVVLLNVIYSLLNSWNILYIRRPQSSQKSIKGYLQVAKIILGFIAGIVILSIMLQKDPSNLFVGLGATAALFSLVFKDTILGFVASIQLSAQDMVRPGDWIEMPSKNADGTVLDINVNSVKVQNWDNTITMIPIYSMVSESFTNWRGMEQSSGRRFVRRFYINIDSISFASVELLALLREHPITSATFVQSQTLARRSSTDNTLTNLSLFRAHLEIYLREHPKVNDQLPLYVRYLSEITEKGVGLELYAFSKDKEAQLFDSVHRSVVEYVLALSGLFEIRLFQNFTGVVVSKAN